MSSNFPEGNDLAELLTAAGCTCCPPPLCTDMGFLILYTATTYQCLRTGYSGWLAAGHPTVTGTSSGHTAVKYYTGSSPTECFYTRSTYAPADCISTATPTSITEAKVGGTCSTTPEFTGSVSLADVPDDLAACEIVDGPNVGAPPAASYESSSVTHTRATYHTYRFGKSWRKSQFQFQLEWPFWLTTPTTVAYSYEVTAVMAVRDSIGDLISYEVITDTVTFPVGTVGGDVALGTMFDIDPPSGSEITTTSNTWQEISHRKTLELSNNVDDDFPDVAFGTLGPCLPLYEPGATYCFDSEGAPVDCGDPSAVTCYDAEFMPVDCP